MNHVEESTPFANQASSSTSGNNSSSKSLVQDALEANKRLQLILAQRAEQLEAKLKEVDQLLASATVEESQDEPESEISIPGAKKATGLFPSSDFLSPASPFYEEATKRSSYLNNITPHSLKPKDIEVLAAAVMQENERLQAYKTSRLQESTIHQGTIDLQNNLEDLDWNKIAEKVSDASSVKRTAVDCRIAWIADKHPTIHTEWSEDELNSLHILISQYTNDKKPVDWVKVAEKLGTNRTPIACMKQGIPRHRHNWSQEADQKLLHAVETYGHDNWQLVARQVSEHVSAGQCHNRWQKTLNPMLRKGAWTEEEDERLRKSVAGYGSSWIQVATAIPGRTNDQCRERWMEYVNKSSAKAIWTPEEDKLLLDLVKERGNQWKSICLTIGNNKTGQNCRLRYDKLKRFEKNPQTSSLSSLPNTIINYGPPQSIRRDESTPQDTPTMSPPTNTHEFSSHPETESIMPTITPSTSAPKGKGKGKKKSVASEPQHASELSQPHTDRSGAASDMMDITEDGIVSVDKEMGTIPVESGSILSKNTTKPKPRPRPRPKRPIKGVLSDIPPKSLAPENNIDLNMTSASGSMQTDAALPNSRPNKTVKSTRVKRKATEAPDSVQVSQSKRTKMSKIEDPKSSLSSKNLEVSGLSTANSSNLESPQDASTPKQRGRPRKAKPSTAIEPVQIAEATAIFAPTEGTSAPLSRTRRQSRRLMNSGKPPS